jgi:hypothetical protein
VYNRTVRNSALGFVRRTYRTGRTGRKDPLTTAPGSSNRLPPAEKVSLPVGVLGTRVEPLVARIVVPSLEVAFQNGLRLTVDFLRVS